MSMRTPRSSPNRLIRTIQMLGGASFAAFGAIFGGAAYLVDSVTNATSLQSKTQDTNNGITNAIDTLSGVGIVHADVPGGGGDNGHGPGCSSCGCG